MNENQIDNYCKVMKVSSDDIAEHLRKVLQPPFSGWVKQYFVRTRNYELGLSFVGICRMLISICSTVFEQKEYINFDITLTYLHLDMLDYSNQWYQYVEEFENSRESKPYSIAYAKDSRKQIGSADDAGDAFYSYVLGESELSYKVHFLYLCSHRYAIIKRKIDRYKAGKSTDYLMRHQQDKLSDAEFEQRLWELQRRLLEFESNLKGG